MAPVGKTIDKALLGPKGIDLGRIMLLAGVYVVSMLVGVSEVIDGNRPAWSTYFLLIPLLNPGVRG